MDNLWIDIIKISFGALLAVGGQFVHVCMTSKKDKNKLRRQKLEEAFIITGDILGEMGKERNLNIENPKIEAGKLHLLISFYAPELQEDYKDFMTTYQEFFWLLKERYDIEDNNMEDIEKIVIKFDSLLALFVSKGNKIKEKLIAMICKISLF